MDCQSCQCTVLLEGGRDARTLPGTVGGSGERVRHLNLRS